MKHLGLVLMLMAALAGTLAGVAIGVSDALNAVVASTVFGF